jgi:hypothetical protein
MVFDNVELRAREDLVKPFPASARDGCFHRDSRAGPNEADGEYSRAVAK